MDDSIIAEKERYSQQFECQQILKQELLSKQQQLFEYQQIEDINNWNYKSSIPLPLFHQVILIIFKEVQDWLNDTKMGTNALLNVSRNFQFLKKANFYWDLNSAYSLEYYIFPQFRDSISRLMKTKKQLSLNLSYNDTVVDVSHLCDVDKINLSYSYNVINVSMLDGVKILDIKHKSIKKKKDLRTRTGWFDDTDM